MRPNSTPSNCTTPTAARSTALPSSERSSDDLLATGGSDAHDERLGVDGLSRRAYERLELPAE